MAFERNDVSQRPDGYDIRLGGADFSFYVAAIPEPASLALIGLGAIAMLSRSRGRRD